MQRYSSAARSHLRRWTGTVAAAALLLGGCGDDGDRGAYAVADDSPLLAPESDVFGMQAPDTFHARFETSAGAFVVEVVRDWAPMGADRFYSLVRGGFYDGTRFFRAIDGFMVQFGLHGDPEVNEAWADQEIPDDPVARSNERGTITFATRGPDTRTTQLFINLGDNAQLDGMGFAPFGRVIEGMDAVNSIYTGYGEGAPQGRGPNQMRVREEGNAYLDRDFPELDRIEQVTITHTAATTEGVPQQPMQPDTLPTGG
jgi:peptidyl-prolyl cis-trans isomerase A (cyclophilin A)